MRGIVAAPTTAAAEGHWAKARQPSEGLDCVCGAVTSVHESGSSESRVGPQVHDLDPGVLEHMTLKKDYNELMYYIFYIPVLCLLYQYRIIY